MGDDKRKNKNKSLGSSNIESICANSKNSSNRCGSGVHKYHSSNNYQWKRKGHKYQSGSDEYVPDDPYMYNLIKGAIDEYYRKEERKSKGLFSRLFRRK